jgi:hypothetical protein
MSSLSRRAGRPHIASILVKNHFNDLPSRIAFEVELRIDDFVKELILGVQRRENRLADHSAIGCVVQLRQCIAKESEARVGIFIESARIARQFVSREKSLQLFRIVVGIGIGRVARHESWMAAAANRNAARRDRRV